MTSDSETLAYTNPWDGPDSLGASTWHRHADIGPSARIPIIQGRQELFRKKYDGHISFASRLIDSRRNHADVNAGNSGFVFGLNQYRGRKSSSDRTGSIQRELMPRMPAKLADQGAITTDNSSQYRSSSKFSFVSIGEDGSSSHFLGSTSLGKSSPAKTVASHVKSSPTIHRSPILSDRLIAQGRPSASNSPPGAGAASSSGYDGSYLALSIRADKKNRGVARATTVSAASSDSVVSEPWPQTGKSRIVSRRLPFIGLAASEHHDDASQGSPDTNAAIAHDPLHTNSLAASTSAELVFAKSDFHPGSNRSRILLRRRSLPMHLSSASEPGEESGRQMPVRLGSSLLARSLLRNFSGMAPADTLGSELIRRSSFEKIGGKAQSHFISGAELPLPDDSIHSQNSEPTVITSLPLRKVERPPTHHPEVSSSLYKASSHSPKPSSSETTVQRAFQYPGTLAASSSRLAKPSDVHHRKPYIQSSLQPVLFHLSSAHVLSRSALQSSNRPLRLLPQNVPLLNRSIIEHALVLRRPSQIVEPGFSLSPRQAQPRHDDRPWLHAANTQPIGIQGREYLTGATPSVTKTLPLGNHHIARTEVAATTRIDKPLANIEYTHPPLQRLQSHQEQVVAYRNTAHPRPARSAAMHLHHNFQPGSAASLSRSVSTTADGWPSLAPQLSNLAASRGNIPRNAAAITMNLAPPPRIARSIGIHSDINRVTARSDRSFLPAEPPLVPDVHRQSTAEYTPSSVISSNRESTGNDDPTAAISLTTGTYATPKLAKSVRGVQPPALPRLQRSQRSIPLTRSHAAHDNLAVLPLHRQRMNASTGSTVFNAGTGGPAHHANVSSYETASAPSRETPDFAKRPLLNLQRKQSQIMRVSNMADSAVPSSGQPEDLYGVVPVPSDHPGGMHTSHKNEGSQAIGSSSGGADPDEVAEQAWRIIAKRLVIEQERRGLTKWP